LSLFFFSLIFSLLPYALSPLCSLSSSLVEVRWRRWPAVLDGGAAAGVVETTPFFKFFHSFSSTPSPLLDSKPKIPKH